MDVVFSVEIILVVCIILVVLGVFELEVEEFVEVVVGFNSPEDNWLNILDDFVNVKVIVFADAVAVLKGKVDIVVDVEDEPTAVTVEDVSKIIERVFAFVDGTVNFVFEAVVNVGTSVVDEVNNLLQDVAVVIDVDVVDVFDMELELELAAGVVVINVVDSCLFVDVSILVVL